MRLHEQAVRLVRRLEGERVEVTPENVEKMRRVRASSDAMLREAEAENLRASIRLSPTPPDCVEHNWYAPRAFPGMPMPWKPWPDESNKLVRKYCPDCKRGDQERVARERAIAVTSEEPRVKLDLRLVESRRMVDENPRVIELHQKNLLRFKKEGQPLPGSEEEKRALERMDDARPGAIARDHETRATRRRRYRRYWAKHYGVSDNSERNWRSNVNAIHARR
jgi:hypothetical protein